MVLDAVFDISASLLVLHSFQILKKSYRDQGARLILNLRRNFPLEDKVVTVMPRRPVAIQIASWSTTPNEQQGRKYMLSRQDIELGPFHKT